MLENLNWYCLLILINVLRMLSLEQFHKLRFTNFSPTYKDKESYDPKDWFYHKTWLGCYSYHDLRIGAIGLNYGRYTGEKLVALEMEQEASSKYKFDADRDAQMKKRACELIGCVDTGNDKQVAIDQIEAIDGKYLELKSPNYKGGYSSLYTYSGSVLCDYILKHGEIMMITIYDSELVLKNRIGELNSSFKSLIEDSENDKDWDEYGEAQLSEVKEELESLGQFDLSNFSHILEAIFVTPSNDVLATNTKIEYKVWAETEEPEDQTPQWVKELNEEDPDILFNFFMNSDMSIVEQLEDKHWELNSFEELKSYREELMEKPKFRSESAKVEEEMFGKKKKFSEKKLRKKFKNLLEDMYGIESKIKPEMDLRKLIKADSDDHLHILRINVYVEIRIDTCMADWDDVQTIDDAYSMLFDLNQNPEKQVKEPMPKSANELQQRMLKQSMEDMNAMMMQTFEQLEND